MKKAYQITETGRSELETELTELKSRRGEIADKIAEARDYGDLSENAEYTIAPAKSKGSSKRVSRNREHPDERKRLSKLARRTRSTSAVLSSSKTAKQ